MHNYKHDGKIEKISKELEDINNSQMNSTITEPKS